MIHSDARTGLCLRGSVELQPYVRGKATLFIFRSTLFHGSKYPLFVYFRLRSQSTSHLLLEAEMWAQLFIPFVMLFINILHSSTYRYSYYGIYTSSTRSWDFYLQCCPQISTGWSYDHLTRAEGEWCHVLQSECWTSEAVNELKQCDCVILSTSPTGSLFLVLKIISILTQISWRLHVQWFYSWYLS
jgi:hypothetical protein